MSEKFAIHDRHHCPLCQRTFTPDAPAHTECPDCGCQHTEYLGELATLIPQPAPKTVMPLPLLMVTCPNCDGEGGSFPLDPQWGVLCRACDGTGIVPVGQNLGWYDAGLWCDLCCDEIDTSDGAKVGVTGLAESDTPGAHALPSFCCEACLSDPENLENLHGILVI